MDNLEEMNKFLEKYNLPKLNQEEIDNLNIPITSKESKTVKKKKKKSSIEQNQTSGPDGLFTLMVTLDTWREQEREREHRTAFVCGKGWRWTGIMVSGGVWPEKGYMPGK